MLPGAGERVGKGWGSTGKGHMGAFGMRRMFCTLMVVVVLCVCKFVKTHQTEHLKRVHFIVCKLYFNKVEKRNAGKLS